MELILITAFTAFFLAVFEPAAAVLSIFVGGRAVNAVSSLLFSGVAVYLSGMSDVRHIVLYTVAGAFLGSAVITVIEQMSFGQAKTRTNYQ